MSSAPLLTNASSSTARTISGALYFCWLAVVFQYPVSVCILVPLLSSLHWILRSPIDSLQNLVVI